MSSVRSVRGIMFVGVTLAVLSLATVAMAQPAPLTQATALSEPQTQTPEAEVRGTARAGDTVRVFQGEALIGETAAGEDGSWQVPILQPTSFATPFRVQIIPATQRGGTEPAPEEPLTVLVSVIVGDDRVDVRVQVASQNGVVDIQITAPLNQKACDCEKPEQSETYHTVKSGETLSKIAGRYGVTAKAIAQANGLPNMNLIYVGQRLLIPVR